jgi:Fe-Mn family superoxide dismutase
MLGSATLVASSLAIPGPRPRAAKPRPPTPDGPFKLPPLGYAFEALEPHIDAQTMTIHHDRHHAAYVKAPEQGFAKTVPELGTTPIEKTLVDAAYVPLQIQQQVKNNLGGHWNHSFFWQLMTPGGAKAPSRRAQIRDRDRIRRPRQDAGTDERSRARALRFWLGLAHRQQEARSSRSPSSANQDTPIEAGRSSGARRRCLGARLLSEISEPPRRLSQGLVEHVNWDKAAANFKTDKV